MSEKVMIQSTCIRCGNDFETPKRVGVPRTVCGPCKPLHHKEYLKKWRTSGGKNGKTYDQNRYRKVVKGIDKDHQLIQRMRQRQAEIDAELSVLKSKRLQEKGVSKEQQQARSDEAVALRRLGL